MTNAIKTTLSALLLASALLGGASSALAAGGYYEGASSTPDTRVYPKQPSSETRNHSNAIDPVNTGSVWNGRQQQPVVNGGDGDYYQGAIRR